MPRLSNQYCFPLASLTLAQVTPVLVFSSADTVTLWLLKLLAAAF